MNSNQYVYYDFPHELNQDIKSEIKETSVVLDIGPGIYPFNGFIPKIHILIEPWSEYIEILKSRFEEDSEVLIIQNEGLPFVKTLSDKSVDSSILIDVIEHMEKIEGLELIRELERVTREQIVIFTPLGFMPQHVSKDRSDRWGLNGGELQQHLSGWTPDDFSPEWNFYVCKNYHEFDDEGKPLEISFGAFYAIKNISDTPLKTKQVYSREFFRKTAKELKIEELTSEILEMRAELEVWQSEKFSNTTKTDATRLEIERLQDSLELLAVQYRMLNESVSLRITKPLRWLKSNSKLLHRK